MPPQSILNKELAGLLLPGGDWQCWHLSLSQSEIALKIGASTAEGQGFCVFLWLGAGAVQDAGAGLDAGCRSCAG